MIASNDEELIDIARRSIITLAEHQSVLGEVPSSLDPVTGQNSYYFLGSIVANLWWLIALDFYTRYSSDNKLKIKLLKNVKRAVLWLKYQDQNSDGLLEQGEACGWADDMPDNGRVLYTNVLWYKMLETYGREKDKEIGFTLKQKYPVKGAGQGGGTGSADIAMGLFGRKEMADIPAHG